MHFEGGNGLCVMSNKKNTMSNKVMRGLGLMRRLRVFVAVLLLITFHLLLITDPVSAAIRDRVTAFVDNQAITLSELEEQHRNAAAISPSITFMEVLNTMINRVILLKEAKNYRIEAPSVDAMLKEYIDLKIRALIRVNDSDIEKFYRENVRNFPGREFEDVRDEIDQYLTEKLLNERLRESIEELRKKSYIKIFPEAMK
jgi:hypothetical protein